ncbi:hypothetical protein Pmani_024455 [Petrolisthes manimaculis]|uniref:Uncharacterized protein n=1 Tax=Petrolisthes manimaculis TaxID=1843537 RepID=A0AAE1P972_9EUCA|nr:hypothetical protein Pmani_024455 [Petrolisthes manimaculis]
MWWKYFNTSEHIARSERLVVRVCVKHGWPQDYSFGDDVGDVNGDLFDPAGEHEGGGRLFGFLPAYGPNRKVPNSL